MNKTINAHVHMVEVEKALKGDLKKALSQDISIFQNLQAAIKLMDPKALLAQMDEAGIERSVLYACEAPILYASNEYVALLCERYKGRLIGFASVDPKRRDAIKVVENAVKKLGLKGLKFHPPLQRFYPNDKRFFPIYKKADELGIPIVFHVGSTPFGSMVRLDQANPILIDEIACAFPKMKIILTHLGTLWHNESFMVVEKNPNVFIDTAAYIYEIKELLTADTVERVGAKKFIFGTDYPTSYGGNVHSMKDFVNCINGLDLPSDIKEGIFYKNFQKILGN